MERNDSQIIKLDGLTNLLTGLAIANKDKRLSSEFEVEFIDQPTAEAMYQTNDIAARYIDLLPEDMTREGFEIHIDDNDNLENEIRQIVESLQIEQHFTKALKWARLYGGSVVFIGVEDGKSPEEPLELNTIKRIEYITTLDRHQLWPDALIDDVTNPNYCQPEFYRLVVSNSKIPRIHHSRLIRFDGIDLPYNLKRQNNHWGDSIYSRFKNPLINFETAYDSTAVTMSDDNVPVWKLNNLTDLLAAGGTEVIQKRIELGTLTMSVLNSIVLQEGEEYERKKTSFAGTPEILTKFTRRLVMASGMPHTILLGEGPDGGIGATGN